MKTKFVILTTAFAFVAFFACKTTKSTTAYTVEDADVTYASTKWEGTTKETLQKGSNVYTGKCNECHALFPIGKFGERKWAHEIDDMAPKAKLTAEEKEQLFRFVMARLNTINATKK